MCFGFRLCLPETGGRPDLQRNPTPNTDAVCDIKVSDEHGGVHMLHNVMSVQGNSLCVCVRICICIESREKPRQPQTDIWPTCPADPLGLFVTPSLWENMWLIYHCYQDVIAL